jgi:Guanylate kinase
LDISATFEELRWFVIFQKYTKDPIKMNTESDYLSDFPTKEVTILPRYLSKDVFSLDFRVGGGAERGELIYCTEVHKHKIQYEEDTTERFSWLDAIPFWRRKQRLVPGDIILAVNGLSVAGMRSSDFYYRIVWKSEGMKPHLRLTITGTGVITQSLKTFLQMGPFPVGTMAARLRKEIQENVSNATIPFTTRPPRDGEVQGREYWFLTEEQRENLESHGYFLQTGQATTGECLDCVDRQLI